MSGQVDSGQRVRRICNVREAIVKCERLVAGFLWCSTSCRIWRRHWLFVGILSCLVRTLRLMHIARCRRRVALGLVLRYWCVCRTSCRMTSLIGRNVWRSVTESEIAQKVRTPLLDWDCRNECNQGRNARKSIEMHVEEEVRRGSIFVAGLDQYMRASFGGVRIAISIWMLSEDA